MLFFFLYTISQYKKQISDTPHLDNPFSKKANYTKINITNNNNNNNNKTRKSNTAIKKRNNTINIPINNPVKNTINNAKNNEMNSTMNITTDNKINTICNTHNKSIKYIGATYNLVLVNTWALIF